MKITKNLSIIFSLVALLVLSLGVASTLSVSTPNDLTIANNQTTVTITNDDTVAQNIALTVSNIVSGSDQVTLSISPTQINNLGVDSSATATIRATSISDDLEFGSYTATLRATGTNVSSGTQISSINKTITFFKSFCTDGEIGTSDLELSIEEVDISSDGDEDEEWKPTDRITVDVNVENTGNDDLNDVFVELGLFDSSGDNIISDLDFFNTDEEEIDMGDLNDGDDDTVTFEFRVPADVDEGDYKLVVKAYSDDEGESDVCTDTSSDLDNNFFQTIDITAEDDEGKFIAFDNIETSPSEATCGDSVTLTADVFNVGDEDQDQVKANLDIDELNIHLSSELRQGLDQGDDRPVSFTFTIPQNARDRTYSMDLSAEYDYRSGTYREESDEAESFALTVLGCSVQPPANNGSTSGRIASISASLDSDAQPGEEMVVRTTITNLMSTNADFVIDASGYESWADLDSISSRLVTIAPGANREVTLTFNVDEDAEGENSFVIRVQSGDRVETREVAVTFDDNGSGKGVDLGDNTLIWIIAGINVVLIIIIIIVAVSVSRRD